MDIVTTNDANTLLETILGYGITASNLSYTGTETSSGIFSGGIAAGIGIESGIKVFLIHLEEAKWNISKGLYYYVGKDKSYSDSVYIAVGRFVSFRSMIDGKEKMVTKEKASGRTNK